MKTLIINGAPAESKISGTVGDRLGALLDPEKSSVTRIDLHQHEIHGCVGCLKCFFRTPGRCVFSDIVREIPGLFVNSDLAVFIIPVAFGGFSSTFARAYNRMMIQLESHLVETVNGELRRKRRSSRGHPAVLFIGLGGSHETQNVFTQLAGRNAVIHLHAPAHSVVFISSNQSIRDVDHWLGLSISSIEKELGDETKNHRKRCEGNRNNGLPKAAFEGE